MGRLLNFVLILIVLTAFVAWRSETPFFETLVNLPSTIVDYMFDPIGDLPFIFIIALQLVLTVGVFAALFWFMGKGGVETYFPDDVSVRFEDVWGQDAVLEKMKENLVFVEDPESIEQRGGHVPGGVLLYGPPGTGKTLMAEAVAGETGKPYVFVEPGAFLNMFFGVGVLKVRSLFKKLRKLALRYGGVIVFFDEADALGNRGVPSGGAGAASTRSPQLCNGMNYLSDATKSSLLFDARAEEDDPARAGSSVCSCPACVEVAVATSPRCRRSSRRCRVSPSRAGSSTATCGGSSACSRSLRRSTASSSSWRRTCRSHSTRRCYARAGSTASTRSGIRRRKAASARSRDTSAG